MTQEIDEGTKQAFTDALAMQLDSEHVEGCGEIIPEMAARIAELEREVAALRSAHAEPPVELVDGRTFLSRIAPATVDGGRDLADPVEPPVEWVDGRTTVGGFVLLDSIDPLGKHHIWSTSGPGSIRIVHDDEETAKRGAVAVARAMGGEA